MSCVSAAPEIASINGRIEGLALSETLTIDKAGNTSLAETCRGQIGDLAPIALAP
jgi:hypothetical protein